MFWFYFTVVLVQVIFSPIILRIYLYTTGNSHRIFFSVYFFGLIKLLSGYITFSADKIYIHISKNTAVQIAFKDVFDTSKKFNVIKSIEILGIKNEISFSQENLFNEMMLSSFTLTVYHIVYGVISQLKPFSKVILGVNQTKNSLFTDLLDVKIAFNVFVIFTILFKKILEVIYAKKQQNRKSYQRGN